MVRLRHELLIQCVTHHTALRTFNLKVRDVTRNTPRTVGRIDTVVTETNPEGSRDKQQTCWMNCCVVGGEVKLHSSVSTDLVLKKGRVVHG